MLNHCQDTWSSYLRRYWTSVKRSFASIQRSISHNENKHLFPIPAALIGQVVSVSYFKLSRITETLIHPRARLKPSLTKQCRVRTCVSCKGLPPSFNLGSFFKLITLEKQTPCWQLIKCLCELEKRRGVARHWLDNLHPL